MQNLEVELTKVVGRIQALEHWQEKQNGQLHEVREDIKILKIEISQKFDGMGEKLSATKNWLIATLSTSLVALIVLVANLVVGKP